MRRHRTPWALAAAGIVLAAGSTFAQPAASGGTATGAAVEVAVGYSGFIDESMVDHAIVGGAVRVGLTRRISFGGEVFYMRGPDSDRDWLAMPLFTFDLRSGGWVPYLVVGAGWLRNTTMVGTGLYSSTSLTVGGGGGVRFDVGRQAYVAVEGRLGTEPLTRATVAIGWRFR